MSDNKMPNSEPEHSFLIPDAEPVLEKLFFNSRGLFLIILLALTVFLGYNAANVGLDSRSEKYIPLEHEYIKNHLRHAGDLSSGLNNIKIVITSCNKN